MINESECTEYKKQNNIMVVQSDVMLHSELNFSTACMVDGRRLETVTRNKLILGSIM